MNISQPVFRQEPVKIYGLVALALQQCRHGVIQSVDFALVGVSFLDEVLFLVKQGLQMKNEQFT